MPSSTEILAVDELAEAFHSLGVVAVASSRTSLSTARETAKPSTSTVSAESSDVTNDSYQRWTLLDDGTLDYGYLSKTGGVGIETVAEAGSGFYITTAINYTNGPAHMGHAYEAATTDVIARFQRLLGERPVYFVTGADEHGQKIANTAAEMKKEPIEICDLYVKGFQVLNQRMRISYDDYVRTTSARHKLTARELWRKCAAAGDIYLDTYQGWYNIREETFVTETEAQLSDFKDPTTGLPLKQVEEESYFFRMSKYKDMLIEHIQNHPEFIQPEQHRNAILSRLQSDELRDLSISRTTFSWGIPVPEGFRDTHVLYVWMDALSNYLTGVNGLCVDPASRPGLEKFWPASVHIIGKDILWFHTVIWPCMLFSAGVPLQKTVFAHGFVNDKEGKKMSKSVGNVVDPHDMLDKYDVDTFRWYLCKEAPYGGELAFSEDNLRDMHNADLCDNIGNLVHRATSLCTKYCGGVVPAVAPPAKFPVDLTQVFDQYKTKMNDFGLQAGAQVASQAFSQVNGYLQDEAPWLKKGEEHAEFRQVVVRATLEAIYALGHLLLPFLPVGASKIFQKLGTEPVSLNQISLDGRNLKDGTKIDVGDVLYQKVLSQEEVNTAAAASATKKESFAEAQKRKKEEKAKLVANSKKKQAADAAASDEDPNQPDFTKMEIRVGKIVKVWNHPEADKLYCEQVDLAEESGPREIASGLRNYYTLEEMQDRKVLVVCNLTPQKMLGFMSNGMVLAAKSEDGNKVELISPPDDAVLGERVVIEGLTGEPHTAKQVKKKKIWETVAKDLKTNADGMATWDGKVIQTSSGPCKASTLCGVSIS